MKVTVTILICVFSVMLLAAPVEAAAAKKKTTQHKKVTCSIKLGKFGKLNIKI